MSETSPDRRQASKHPPTAFTLSLEAMGRRGRKRLRRLGKVLMAIAVLFPLVGGLVVELSGYYWLACGVLFLVGFFAYWPEGGAWLLERLPGTIKHLVPKLWPERRSGDRRLEPRAEPMEGQ